MVFGKKWRRELIICGKRIKYKLFWPFEVLGFAILVVGLVIEMAGSFSAGRLQSKENATLESTNVLLSLRIEELRQENNALELSIRPRAFSWKWEKFRNALIGMPKMRAELLYPSEDSEAYLFAEQIALGLRQAEWVVIDPRPARENDVPKLPDGWINITNAPITDRLGSSGGTVWLLTKAEQPDNQRWQTNNALGALQNAFSISGMSETGAGVTIDLRLPDDLIRIVVGAQHP